MICVADVGVAQFGGIGDAVAIRSVGDNDQQCRGAQQEQMPEREPWTDRATELFSQLHHYLFNDDVNNARSQKLESAPKQHAPSAISFARAKKKITTQDNKSRFLKIRIVAQKRNSRWLQI